VTDPTNYLISFDLDKIVSNVTELQKALTALSTGVITASDKSLDGIVKIENSIKSIDAILTSNLSKLDNFYENFASKIKASTKNVEGLTGNIETLLTKIKKVDEGGGFPKPPRSTDRAALSGSTFTRMSAGTGDKLSEKELEGAAKSEAIKKASKDAIMASKKADKEWKLTSTKIGGYIEKEAKTAVNKVKGIMSGFTTASLGGGIAGAMIGLMMLGVKEKQRKGAESGEMLNAIEAFGEVTSARSKKATAWLSEFQENAQWKFKIAREEIQGLVTTLAHSGIKEFLDSDFDKPIDDVNANVATLTLGLDKYMNKATGSAMKATIGIVEDYGYSARNAAERYKKLALEAQASGMDIDKFTGAVLSSSSNLRQYGIELEDVSGLMRDIKDSYEKSGMSSQQAGKFAAQVVQSAGKIFSASEGMMADMFRNYYKDVHGMDLDAITALQRGRTMILRPEERNSDKKINMFGYVLNYLKNLVGVRGNSEQERVRFIQFLTQELGMDAISASKVAELALKGDITKGLKNATPAQIKELEDAFKTEGEQLTELAKNQRDVINALAKIGEGLLGIASGLIATLVLGFRSLINVIPLAYNMMFGKDNETKEAAVRALQAIGNAQTDISKHMLGSLNKVFEGGDELIKAFKDNPVFKTIMDPVKIALDANVGDTTMSSIFNDIVEGINYLRKSDNLAMHLIGILFEMMGRYVEIIGKVPGVVIDSILNVPISGINKGLEHFGIDKRMPKDNVEGLFNKLASIPRAAAAKMAEKAAEDDYRKKQAEIEAREQRKRMKEKKQESKKESANDGRQARVSAVIESRTLLKAVKEAETAQHA
jgi:hypothetical protein